MNTTGGSSSKVYGELTLTESDDAREIVITTGSGQRVRFYMHGDVAQVEIDGAYVTELSLDDSSE